MSTTPSSSLIRMSGLTSGLDTESIVKQLMSAEHYKSTKIENKITKLEWKQDKWKTLNSKIYSFYSGPLAKAKLQGTFITSKTESSDTSKVEVSSKGSVPQGTHSITVSSVANTMMVTGAELSLQGITYSSKLSAIGLSGAVGKTINITAGKNSSTFTINTDSTVGDFVSALQKTGLNASFDTTRNRFYISSKESGIANAFSITSTDVDLKQLGLSNITTEEQADKTVKVLCDSTVKAIDPADAIINYNGVDMSSSSNTISVNGLVMTVKAKTTEAVKISVSRDTDSVYNMIKGFVKSYNEVLKSMNDAYDADTAKGYEPLTDTQKEAMTDDEVTKWEDKIKNSLLRRDSSLEGVIGSMRSKLSNCVTYNEKKYSLASFGITSPDYAENGLLHIDGDSDDSLTSVKEDKLKKALSEDPDAVMKTFNELADNLYDDMTNRMKSTSLRSSLTFYNDKEMKKTLTQYKSDLSDMQNHLEDLETRYYKQFTALETAMAKLNSQSSSLTSMLGSK